MECRILLLGATGYTGQLVAKELLKNNIKFYLSGSNSEKLQKLSSEWSIPFFAMDLTDSHDLKKIPEEIKYILNCAGPFGLFAPKLLEFISSKKIVYLDVTGEAAFVFSSYQSNKNTHATLMHACAFESFIADALASHFVDKHEDIVDLSAFYFFPSPKISPGTRLSMQLVRHFQAYRYENGRWVERVPGEIKFEIQFEGVDPRMNTAVYAPYPEVVFFSKTHRAQTTGSYILAKGDDWIKFGGREEKKSIDDILKKHQSTPRPGPDEADRKKAKFMVGVRALYKDKKEKRFQVFGVDSYQITAAIMVQTLIELMKQKVQASGVFAPSELVDSYKILESLKSEFDLSFS